MHLLDDPNAFKVCNIEEKHRGNAERINTEILQEWAAGRGMKPVSWETLSEVLRDIQLAVLANEIKVMKLG